MARPNSSEYPISRAHGYIRGQRLGFIPDDRSWEVEGKAVPLKPVEFNVEEIRMKFKHMGIPTYSSDVVPIGKPVFVDHGALPYTYGIYAHPIDYAYIKYNDKPEVAHNVASLWIENRIEQMADEANARLDRMFNDFEREHDFRGLSEKLGISVEALRNSAKYRSFPVDIDGITYHELASHDHMDAMLYSMLTPVPGQVSLKPLAAKYKLPEQDIFGYPDDWDSRHRVEHKSSDPVLEKEALEHYLSYVHTQDIKDPRDH